MLDFFYNIALKNKIIVHKKNNSSEIMDIPNLSKSVFYELKKTLLRKEIEFLNIDTEDKKHDNKNIIFTNFTINNLLNFLNTQEKNLNTDNVHHTKNKNIKKKK